MKTKIVSFCILLFALANLSAQDGYKVKKDSLYSEILKQNRRLSIFLPEGYEAAGKKFPVVYVLDADGRCQHIVPTARFLFLNNKMPQAIIVGVYNIDRSYDFLPASSGKPPMGGGADNFMQFFKKELIPFIDNKYKTENYNVIVGHSFGGVFAMHSFLNDPDIFNSYVVIDPSFWYDNRILIKDAGAEFQKDKNWGKTIYITGREGDGMINMAIAPMDSLLKSSAPKELDWKVVAYADEDHGSVTFKSSYDGLRFIFDNGGNFQVYPQTGIIPKGTFTYAFIQNNNPNLRYTLDGTEPGFNSPACKDTIRINKACTLMVKTVSRKYNKVPATVRIFTEGEFMNGLKSVKNLRQGLKYSYYEGGWDSLPDFSKLMTRKMGSVDSLNLKMAMKKDSFALKFEGYIHITEKALYNLWVTSDDGARVYLDNKLLLNNDGLHAADRPVVSLLPLNPGYYSLTIEYFQKTGDAALTLGYLIGNSQPTPVPKGMLFYKEK